MSDPARIAFFLWRNPEVIGKACNNVRQHDPAFIAAHPEILRGSAIGNRNALSHSDFTIRFPALGVTLQRNLLALRVPVARLLF